MKSAKKNKQAKQALDPIASEFISFVAHQIKSPLVAIKGYADLIANGHYGEVNEEVKDIALKIRAASNRSLDLAYNLLDLKKIEEGRMQYSFEAVDLNKVISEVKEELEAVAEKKNLDLIFNPEVEVIARADRKSIHQVIYNLVENAIKYTDHGWVKLEASAAPKGAIIKVSDSGRGMSKETMKIAFDKFSRDANIHKIIHGTGLGLFIVKSIIKDHKGKVWAESEGEGKGSQFYIELKK